MQGKKNYQEKLFLHFHLSDYVPENNFYRRLKSVLNLDFLYAKTKKYYGDKGQSSIDSIVFFKLCLVGYLENIISDRKIIEHSSMRLDILYFLGYNIDEPLPWHSTLSRTRQLFEEGLFEEVFTHILSMCIDKGMVSGHTQAIDSAPVKANASMAYNLKKYLKFTVKKSKSNKQTAIFIKFIELVLYKTFFRLFNHSKFQYHFT